MAQHDYVIDNQSGSAFRSDLNNALSAIVSTNSGGSAPSTTYAYMVWADTTTGIRKMRNGANNAWINIGDLNGNVLVLDSNKNVGIGTSSPSDYNASYDNAVIYQASGDAGLTIATSTTAAGGIAFADGTSGTAEYSGYINYNHSDEAFYFGTAGTTRVRINLNGQVAWTAAAADQSAQISNTAGAGTTSKLIIGQHSASAGTFNTGTISFQVFTNGNTQNTNGVYTTITSDERFKQDIADVGSQWDDIKNITLKKFRYKNDPTGELQLGVIAQELEQVCPNLVTRRIADTNDVIASGNTVTEGDEVLSWKMSILPLKAVKALQEAMTRIEELEAKVAALEAA